MKQVVAELTHLAPQSSDISQRSGVSVRVTICNYENLLSNALKRAIRLGEGQVAPRVSDLAAIVASTSGKIELETLGDGGEDKVIGKLVQRAVLNVFNRTSRGGELDEVVAAFQGGLAIEVADDMPSTEYVRQIGEVRPLHAAAKKLGAGDPAGGGLRGRVRAGGPAPLAQAQQGRARRPLPLPGPVGGGACSTATRAGTAPRTSPTSTPTTSSTRCPTTSWRTATSGARSAGSSSRAPHIPQGGQHARAPGPARAAAQAAAAAAQPLRPRLRARGHQEEARRDPEDGARGHRAAPRRGARAARRRARSRRSSRGSSSRWRPSARQSLDALPEGARRAASGAPELRVHGPRGPPQFWELMRSLQQQMLQPFLQGMQQALQNMTPGGPRADAGDAARPQPHAARAGRGQGARLPGVQGQVGPALPRGGEPRSAPRADGAQMAQMQSLMESMSPEQRRQLQDMMQSLFMQDERLEARAGPARHEPLGADAAWTRWRAATTSAATAS